jgi:hypothetical protein
MKHILLDNTITYQHICDKCSTVFSKMYEITVTFLEYSEQLKHSLENQNYFLNHI